MKNKKIFSYFLAFVAHLTLVSAQEKVFETEQAFLKPKNKGNGSYAFSNQKSNELLLLSKERSVWQAILLDQNYQEISKVQIKPLSSNYIYLMGYTVVEGTYNLIFTNAINSKFLSLSVNMKNKNVSVEKIDLKLNKERFLESIVYNNELFILSITRLRPEISIYALDASLAYRKTIIDLENLQEDLNKNRKTSAKNLYYYFLNEKGTIPYVDVSKITSENPNNLESASRMVKLYQSDNKIYLTFDQDVSDTKVVEINLDTLKKVYRKIPKFDSKINLKQTNSFLTDKTIFQVGCNEEQLHFQIRDFMSGSLLKNDTQKATDFKLFGQSEYIKERRSVKFNLQNVPSTVLLDDAKENGIDEVSQKKQGYDMRDFFYKINKGNLAITASSEDTFYSIKLGATSGSERHVLPNYALTFKNPSSLMLPVSNGAFQIPSRDYFNYANNSFYNFYGYLKTKSNYLPLLLDTNYNYSSEPDNLNVFDTLGIFIKSLRKPIAENIFTHQGVLHYNFLDPKTGLFSIYRIE